MRIPALAMLAFGVLLATSPARAQTYGSSYPICLHGFGKFDQIDCSYASIDQCQLSARGLAAQCIANPYYAGAHAREPRAPYRHHRRAY